MLAIRKFQDKITEVAIYMIFLLKGMSCPEDVTVTKFKY